MNDILYLAVLPILLGVILDTLLGDPYWLPHPIRLFGNTISLFDRLLNKGQRLRLKGATMAIILVATVGFSIWFVQYMLSPYPIILCLVNSILFFYSISNRSLIEEALKVESRIQKNDIDGARIQLRNIVGRDTSQLTPIQMRAAILETLSENLSDGVIAPLFYYALGGIPLMMAYKMINTLDSMVGYKNERYIHFGWFSAKLDDVVNFIPARITAVIMAFLPPNIRAIKFIFRYGNKHASPNSGYPEAALAGLLNCSLGGPNIYHGKIMDKPFIGSNERQLYHSDIIKASLVNIKVTSIAIVVLLILAVATSFSFHGI